MKRLNKNALRLALLLGLILALAARIFGSAGAQGSLDATLTTDSADITVGDVIPLTLRVTHPAGWRVIFPALEQAWGDFEVRSQGEPVITTNSDGTQTTTREIQVARMRPGDVQTPALTLQVADDQGSLNRVEAAPLPISVRSVLVEGDTTLREIKPQAELVTEQRPVWPLVIAGLLSLVAAGYYAVQRWQQRKLIDRRTPRQKALDALTALIVQAAEQPEDVKSQAARLADLLRDYLAASTRLPVRDLTTRELSRTLMEQDAPITRSWGAKAVEVLQVCDGVKFANEDLEAAQLQLMIAMVKQLVEQYPPAPQPAPRNNGRKKHKKQMKVVA